MLPLLSTLSYTPPKTSKHREDGCSLGYTEEETFLKRAFFPSTTMKVQVCIPVLQKGSSSQKKKRFSNTLIKGKTTFSKLIPRNGKTILPGNAKKNNSDLDS